MGCCASSTETTIDPHTGKQVTKTSLGGAYPGQRRPNAAPYAPDASQFGPNGQATAHFKAVNGGNALMLVRQDGTPVPMEVAPQYIQVTLPTGVSSGQVIHVQAPDGAINAITVPPGFGPGSTFTVEFAPPEKQQQQDDKQFTGTAAASKLDQPYSVPPPAAVAGDDGFVSGFGNNNRTTPVTAAATTNFSDAYYAQYATPAQQQATPVYPKW